MQITRRQKWKLRANTLYIVGLRRSASAQFSLCLEMRSELLKSIDSRWGTLGPSMFVQARSLRTFGFSLSSVYCKSTRLLQPAVIVNSNKICSWMKYQIIISHHFRWDIPTYTKSVTKTPPKSRSLNIQRRSFWTKFAAQSPNAVASGHSTIQILRYGDAFGTGMHWDVW